MDARITDGKRKFDYRVAGILIHNDKVLLHKRRENGAWAPVGGGCEIMEKSSNAAKREFEEETGIKVNIKKLLWVVEDFFNYDDLKIHQVAMYYLLELKGESKYTEVEEFKGIEVGKNLKFKWFDIASIETADIKPAFLKTYLNNINDNIKHLVIEE